MFKKVLVCAPTAKAKNYCFDQWIENVMSFKYPEFKVALYDNTQDGGANAKYLNRRFSELYGNTGKFTAYHSKTDKITSVIERMCISHNLCRELALNEGYDYILHLETDVFPNPDVIESLMYHNKQVVGALYDRDEGIWRKTMLQKRIYNAPFNISSVNFLVGEELHVINGEIKQFAHVGLGCVLIHSSVLKKIKFRFVSKETSHPDTYFAEDCFRNKIKIYGDTSLYCRHENTPWGVYGLDFI